MAPPKNVKVIKVVQVEDQTLLLLEEGLVAPFVRFDEKTNKKYSVKKLSPLQFLEQDGSCAFILQVVSQGKLLVALSEFSIFTCEYCGDGVFDDVNTISLEMDFRHSPAISHGGLILGFDNKLPAQAGRGQVIAGDLDGFEPVRLGYFLPANRINAKIVALGDLFFILAWAGKRGKETTSRVFVASKGKEGKKLTKLSKFTEGIIKDIAATKDMAYVLYENGAVGQSSNLTEWYELAHFDQTKEDNPKALHIAGGDNMSVVFNDSDFVSFLLSNDNNDPKKSTVVHADLREVFGENVTFESLVDMDVSDMAVFLVRASVDVGQA